LSIVGKVKNGAVILPAGANLPDGTRVRIEPLPEKTLAERMKEVIGSVKDLPADLAERHDRYIHGAGKK
jgi:hypothetical protein